MAQKRMFTMKIVDSDAFLDMPLSSQCLYFHLNMRADDDGFVGNPKRIMRLIGANDDDLKILLAKRFLIIFEDNVVVIKHWWMHNTLAKDRYQETSYTDEKALLKIKDNKSYTLGNEGQEIKEPPCSQNVNKMLTKNYQKDNTDIDIDIDIDKEQTHIESCVPVYIQEPYKNNKADTQEFLQECFNLIAEHNKTAVHKIPISKDYFTFIQGYKEGKELLELTKKADIPDLRTALENYLKVARSKTWMNTFSISVFCKNYNEYTKEFFDMTKYLNIPRDKVKLINEQLDKSIREHCIFRLDAFIYHRKEWFSMGMPEGEELQTIVKRWELEDEQNNVNYAVALVDWEKDME